MYVYAANTALPIIYTLAFSGVTGIAATGLDSGANPLGQIIGGVILLVLNRVYYNKRAHLFVN